MSNTPDAAVQPVEPLRVAALPHRGPYQEIRKAFETLVAWANANGVGGPGTQVIGMYHDDPRVTPEAELRSAACISVGDDIAADADAGVEILELPGGDHAVCVHRGPYDTLPETYAWLIDVWLPAAGRVPSDEPAYEVYLNDPSVVDPEDIETEIHIPLA